MGQIEVITKVIFKTECSEFLELSLLLNENKFELTDLISILVVKNKNINLIDIEERIEKNEKNLVEKSEILLLRIAKVIKFAEEINMILYDIVTLYKRFFTLLKYKELDELAKFKKRDFMFIKDLFFRIINKKNEHFSIKKTVKLKEFKKMFKNFINDRNIFTHGNLMFEYPNFYPVLKYFDFKDNCYKTKEINNIILNTYIENYTYIRSNLITFSIELTEYLNTLPKETLQARNSYFNYIENISHNKKNVVIV
jgi:hypothetical protein